MTRSNHLAVAIGITYLLAFVPTVDAQTLFPSADTNIEEHTPDSDDTTQPRIQVRSRAESGSGRQNVGYIQFDLSGVGALTEATFRTTMQTTRASAAGDNQVYGLNDVAGNTAQNWTNLTYNTTGDEIPGDGDSETQDLGTIGTTGAENLWAIGDLPEIAGTSEEVIQIDEISNPELLNFLNTRVGDLATLLIVQANAVDTELLFNSSEDPPELSPQLIIPEPTAMVLLALGSLAWVGLRRRS